MSTIFDHLDGSDALLPPDDGDEAGASRRRVLGRLGQYAALVTTPLNMRPTSATLHSLTADRVEVRISTAGAHIVLAIALEGDFAAEIFFVRALAMKHLPAPRLITYDLSSASVPFAYAIFGYVSGFPLSRLDNPALVRIAARQVGRTLRRVHQSPAPGFGCPTASGRWRTRSWIDTLDEWLKRREFLNRGADILGADGLTALLAATLEHPSLACEQPFVIHGAVEPSRALVTVGDTAQLEALVRAGPIVGGDPLFDLAHGLAPRHPAAFRQGLLEGYMASGQLSPEQEQRLQRLQLLLTTADTLQRAEPAALARLSGDVSVELAKLDC
jgi:aminoglycoside phosphotransferase (APT) family kinase protein